MSLKKTKEKWDTGMYLDDYKFYKSSDFVV